MHSDLNDWKTILRARREKRLRKREIARRKREMGARAIIGYARIKHPGTLFEETRYLSNLGYGKEARETWPMYI